MGGGGGVKSLYRSLDVGRGGEGGGGAGNEIDVIEYSNFIKAPKAGIPLNLGEF